MKIIISSEKLYLNEPCNRCGSEKRVAKKWKEIMPTLTGTTVIKHTQIVCMNEACQMESDEMLRKEAKKRQDVRTKKEANDAIRKANIITSANKTRKNTSRI